MIYNTVNGILLAIMLLKGYSLKGQRLLDTVPYNCSGSFYVFEEGEVFTIVERMPEYPGGAAVMMKAFRDNMDSSFYSIVQNERQSKINVSFVIDTSGNVINKCVERPYYPDKLTPMENAALQALDKMPKWTPGEISGKKVAVAYNLPMKIHMR